jgi:hypothetical protein
MTQKPKPTPLGETAHTIHMATMAMIFTLEASQRADLTAPLADILKALSQLDYKGLEEVDRRNTLNSRRSLGRSGIE